MSAAYRFYQTVSGQVHPKSLTVGAMMKREPKTLRPDDLVRDAMHLMSEHNLHHVPLVSQPGNKVVGLVTETDLLTKVLHGKHLNPAEAYHASMDLMLPLKSIMCREVEVAVETELVSQVVKLFLKRHFRCVPIVDSSAGLIGMLTESDLMHLLDHMLD